MLLLIKNIDAFDKVALLDGVDNIEAVDDAAETGVDAIEMLGIGAVVADEELAAAGVLASMSHGQDATVVVLLRCIGLAFDAIARAASANAWVAHIDTERAAALDDEIGDDAVEMKAIVEAILGEFDKVSHSVGYLIVVK